MIHENKWPIELFSSAEKEGVKKGLEEKKVQYISEIHYFLRSLTNHHIQHNPLISHYILQPGIEFVSLLNLCYGG